LGVMIFRKILGSIFHSEGTLELCLAGSFATPGRSSSTSGFFGGVPFAKALWSSLSFSGWLGDPRLRLPTYFS
jgi:hypothetical protein